jgi:G3E family GTPase
MCSPPRRARGPRSQALLRALNPGAELLRLGGGAAAAGAAALPAALAAPRFDWEATQRRAGWLRALERGGGKGGGGGSDGAQPPGGSCFVYRARWPFHPGRLHDFVVRHFLLQERDWGLGSDDGDGGSDDGGGGSDASSDAGGGGVGGGTPAGAEVAARAAARHAAFGRVVRSKGFVWLATRGDHMGEWSQAGDVLGFTTGALGAIKGWSVDGGGQRRPAQPQAGRRACQAL